VCTRIYIQELKLMPVISVTSCSAPGSTSNATVRYILGIGLSPAMCVGSVSSRAGTSSSINARTQVKVCTSVSCVRRCLHKHSTLTIHKRIHTGQTPYKCDVCDNDFVCKALLTVHQKTHKKCSKALNK
jgi:hypothetical protein